MRKISRSMRERVNRSMRREGVEPSQVLKLIGLQPILGTTIKILLLRNEVGLWVI